ncbi:unnamed protein product [Paramecium sonneborni]|uniref:Uncharacterized protein n=1 Tax=Paramecium sonneborni TaxID=65129 RepID=A0A8S1RVL2_9CILI|nr:unnamed protein product [Paramecium sonneborni]
MDILQTLLNLYFLNHTGGIINWFQQLILVLIEGSYLFGTMAEDGKYLITQDNSNSIQIRIEENL